MNYKFVHSIFPPDETDNAADWMLFWLAAIALDYKRYGVDMFDELHRIDLARR